MGMALREWESERHSRTPLLLRQLLHCFGYSHTVQMLQHNSRILLLQVTEHIRTFTVIIHIAQHD